MRELEQQMYQCQEWEAAPKKEALEHWHDPAFIAMMEELAAEEKEIDRCLYLDF